MTKTVYLKNIQKTHRDYLSIEFQLTITFHFEYKDNFFFSFQESIYAAFKSLNGKWTYMTLFCEKPRALIRSNINPCVSPQVHGCILLFALVGFRHGFSKQ